jgi:hypothetical protein
MTEGDELASMKRLLNLLARIGKQNISHILRRHDFETPSLSG